MIIIISDIINIKKKKSTFSKSGVDKRQKPIFHHFFCPCSRFALFAKRLYIYIYIVNAVPNFIIKGKLIPFGE